MAEAASLSLATDRGVIAKGARSKVFVVIEMNATGKPVEVRRPKLRVMFALDVSGSMHGPPIEHAMRSVEAMLGILKEGDSAGLVAFSNDATEVGPLAPIEEARRTLRGRLSRVTADGSTNIEAGLELAAKGLGSVVAGSRNVVLLLSDGAPNVGVATPEGLGEIARQRRTSASFSTLGYGPQHHEDVLAAIADMGGGAYRYVPDPRTAAVEFGAALGAQGDVVADRIEIVLAPQPGVEISRVLGRRPARFSGVGMHVTMPDLLEGASQLAVVELDVTASREGGRMPLLDVTLAWHAASTHEARKTSERVSIDVGGADGPLVPAAHARVLLVMCDDVRADARAMADRGQWDGAAAVLRKHMDRIASVPGYKAGDGSQLSEAYEQLLDEAMAYERRPAQEQYRQFRQATRGLATAVSSALFSAQGAYARALSADLAGPLPKARIEILSGPDAGQVRALGPRNVFGRTGDADVVIASSAVSRRHAQIFAHAGRFWLADLGTTNTTELNGARLATEHAPLSNGDRIKIGDVEMRYIED
jgi:Ca-activated chloride channel family protein